MTTKEWKEEIVKYENWSGPSAGSVAISLGLLAVAEAINHLAIAVAINSDTRAYDGTKEILWKRTGFKE